MARAMFEYTKEVLRKVSFDTTLFTKEVKKAVKHLLPYEIEELKLFIISLLSFNPDLQKSLIYLEG
ncbi:hypothetical protein [Psychroflexus maritimus]|uniref:Uncharacterized protein n=1 Tax=Psychroflexus maritimus TaxID=2714865 RepID=A0A967AI33_9FLAO|nr:hypothetical protein [Psychroflexus maritimus]NGZ88769.1 hypothetical protein [Psychroflexus maritimus]